MFFDEEELVVNGIDFELTRLFDEIERHSSPLTDELFELIQSRSRMLEQQRKRDREDSARFMATDYVQPWEGLSHVSGKRAEDARKDAFLKEWVQTLQIIRDLAVRVAANRPSWVSEDAPLGAQADQFLHAYYYQRTFDGQRADYESHYQRNRTNPDKAVDEALTWWKGLGTAPNNEDRMLNEWAPYLKSMLARDRLTQVTEEELVGVLTHVHAAIDYARRVSNRLVGLPGGRQYSIDDKVSALAHHIYNGPENGRPSALETWNYVLYDGYDADLPSRLWNALA